MIKKYAILDKNNNVITTSIAEEAVDSNMIEITESNCFYSNISFYENGYFYSKQPYPSWTKLNGQWISPSTEPKGTKLDNGLTIVGIDGKTYTWKEDQLSWIDMQTQIPPSNIT